MTQTSQDPSDTAAEQPLPYDPLTEALNRIEAATARVAVLGQGYVGLPVSMRASAQGFPTVGFEIDETRRRALQSGTSYVEDISHEELQAALARGYRATSDLGDLKGFDVAVITVPTPLRDGAPDLSYVATAAEQLSRVIRAGSVVILESTTYPGTTEELLRPILERSGLRAGHDFFLGYSPERIDPGNETWNLVNTPKVVSGIDAASRSVVSAFYQRLVDQVVEVDSAATAELVKILENTYRHVNIALVNELAMFARDLGVDVWSAIDAAATKPFGFTPFRPGPGVGGHCLPIDPSYLSWRVRQNLGHTFRFVELANDVNDHMPDYVVTRISLLLNNEGKPIKGSRILLLGLTYKAGTSDWRESPSIEICHQLASLGADLRLCDPHLAEGHRLDLPGATVELNAKELAAADIVVVLVDHREFDPHLIAGQARLAFDTKGLLRGTEFRGELL